MLNSVRQQILSRTAYAASRIASNSAAQRLLFNAMRLDRQEFARFWAQDDLKFLSYAFARRDRSRSQILQDLWVCYELEEKTGGYFVEFGATDGRTNSNTWLLETQLGWSGVLAEPNPFWHEDLAANRGAAIDHRCVYSVSGEAVDFLTTDDADPELSAIAGFAGDDHFASTRQQGNRIQVDTVSLQDLLDSYAAPPHIDYLSIDTEGSELEILSQFDFDSRRFSLISVEQNPTTDQPLQALLTRHGYYRVFPQFSQWDAWYVAAELRRRPERPFYAPSA